MCTDTILMPKKWQLRSLNFHCSHLFLHLFHWKRSQSSGTQDTYTLTPCVTSDHYNMIIITGPVGPNHVFSLLLYIVTSELLMNCNTGVTGGKICNNHKLTCVVIYVKHLRQLRARVYCLAYCKFPGSPTWGLRAAGAVVYHLKCKSTENPSHLSGLDTVNFP